MNLSIWGVLDETALGVYTQPAVICYASPPSKEASVLITLGCSASCPLQTVCFFLLLCACNLLLSLTSLLTLLALHCSPCFPWYFPWMLDFSLTFPLNFPGTQQSIHCPAYHCFMCISLSLSLDCKAFGVKSRCLQVNSPNIYQGQLSVKKSARYLVGTKNWAVINLNLQGMYSLMWEAKKLLSSWKTISYFKIKNYGSTRKGESLILIVSGSLKTFQACSVKREEWNEEGGLESRGLGNVVTRETSGKLGYNSWLSPNSMCPGMLCQEVNSSPAGKGDREGV